jgi:hypothetical protein
MSMGTKYDNGFPGRRRSLRTSSSYALPPSCCAAPWSANWFGSTAEADLCASMRCTTPSICPGLSTWSPRQPPHGVDDWQPLHPDLAATQMSIVIEMLCLITENG